MKKIPKLCNKNYDEIFENFKFLSSQFTPEWKFSKDDFGLTFAKIFCEMQENTINKLNYSMRNIYLTFLKMIDVSPKPRFPAQGMITIEAAKNLIPSCIRKGAKIDSDGDTVFETTEDVYVMENKIENIFMASDSNDKIVKVFEREDEDTKFKKFKLFDFSKFENLQSKMMFLCDEKMFDSQNPDLKFKFHDNLSQKKEKELFDFLINSKWQYYNEKEKSWKDSCEITKCDDMFINVKFDEKIGISDILGKKSRYIRIIPSSSEEINVTNISYLSNPKNLKPNQFLSGEDEIDEKEFFPFKERYYIYDCFYIKCDEAFNKPGANITLSADINFVKIKVEIQGVVKNYKMIMSDMDFAESEPSDIKIESVVWEYWKGNSWTSLNMVKNENFFSPEGKSERKSIEFVCPYDIQETNVGAKSGIFIRARIMKMSNQFSNYANYIVPYMKNVNLNYSYKNVQKFKNITVNSDLEWRNIQFSETEEKTVNLFKNEENEHPAIYIKISKPISSGILSMFFDIDEGVFKYKNTFSWQYWAKESNNSCGWQTLDIIDFTDNFTKSGIVKILSSKKFEKLKLFGTTGYFIRILNVGDLKNCNYMPTIRDIQLNVVKVIQKESKPYEYFSVNVREKNKICSLSSPDIFDVQVWVDEFEEISNGEQNKLEANASDKIEIKKNKSGITEKIWIKWKEINNILNAGPMDRAYSVDYDNSKVIFGDGKHGKIPTEQFGESIRIKYSTTKGKKGNIDASSIGDFESVFPSVLKVYNSKPMYGGLDTESIDVAADRTFDEISRGGRLVSITGFEKSIIFQNQNIFKVKCFPHVNKYGEECFGDLTIVILPKVPMIGYDKFSTIREQIREFITNNAPVNLSKSKNLNICEAQYVEFYVSIVATVRNLDDYQNVHNEINTRIKKFLDPINGGQSGSGFEIGKIPGNKEILSSISFIPKLDYVNRIQTFTKVLSDEGKKEISLSDAKKLKFAVPILKNLDIKICN